MKNKSLAIVLALFTGGIGGHWFYLERPARGVAYLMLCWTFVPTLLAICEIFWMLFMSKENWKFKFGYKAEQA